MADPLYDRIGATYSAGRRTDPRIASQLHAALGHARSVLNVGAGTGNYEPADRDLVAVEPSAVMRAQRPLDAAPVVAGVAEALPFAPASFDVAMALLSDHHWTDRLAGVRELARVGRRVVLFQWDNVDGPEYWMVRDYLPEFRRAVADSTRPSWADAVALLRSLARQVAVRPVPIPWDCADGFFHAAWRRPEVYLDEDVRRATSVWSWLGPEIEDRAVAALRADLASGEWHRRNADLLALDEADLGARLVIADI